MEVAIIVLLGLLLAGIVWLVLDRASRRSGDSARLLQAQYESLRSEMQSSLNSNLKLVVDQLASVTSQIQSSTGQMNTRMDNASRAVGDVKAGLGELSKATERIFEVGKDISSLQEILRSPKLRGGLGELFLADLLAQCLPSSHYSLQHTFSTGVRVDAVIRLKGGLVPIDSKFPLENFRRLSGVHGDERKAARRRFLGDCKKHIDAIAGSYIRPTEGTLNFALMYIPAENVYYEMIIKDADSGDAPLSSYAFSRRVIPVSPNSFYAYMQTILLGLRGMEISEKAVGILAHLDALKGDFERLSTDLATLGRHISFSKTKFDEVDRKAGRFADRLAAADAGPGGAAGPGGEEAIEEGRMAGQGAFAVETEAAPEESD
ncbi:MAG: DNA recombination protein RmuC [Thermodesulfobacteriota bacterium]